MGHGFCGGCAAALTGQFDNAEPWRGPFHRPLDRHARRGARQRSGRDMPMLGREAFLEMELEGVRISLANLRTFPWVREREAGGRLKLHGAYFAIADGILHVCDEASGEFAPA